MTQQDMFILYVGEAERGEVIRATVALDGGYVYLPEHMMQALGMYITYLPNVIIVDAAVSYSSQIIEHLRSVDARPILLLTDGDSPRLYMDGVFTMSRGSTADEVVEAARQLANGGSMLHAPVYSNGYRRTG
jgi:hypothetical protein